MNVLLINPPWVLCDGRNLWRNVASVMPPLGLGWMAAVLEQEGHRVRILDAHADRVLVEQVPLWVRQHGPFDLVGVSATTPLIASALQIARLLKAEWPETRIVLGGVHATVLPEEVLADQAVDLVVRGEGENTLREIAAGNSLEAIDGISYRLDGQIVHNPDRELIRDLDSLPFPAYHLLPMDKYRPAAGAAKRTPATSVLATRGCPGRCTFCYRLFGSRLRCRSGRHVADEVEMLQDRYGIREICFYDDTFTAVRHEVKAFCREIDRRNLDLTWSCFSRVDTFHEEVFRTMKHSGCHQVMFGVETCSRPILDRINKRTDPEMVEGVIRNAQKIGMEVRAAFMLGSPGETEATMEENIRFAIRLQPDLALFNVTTPFPGTEMFEWADRNGYLMTKNWQDYDLSTPVLRLPTVSPETIRRYYRRAHRRFYLRPRTIFNRLKRMRTRQQWSSALRGLRMLLG